jgi:hypothetical protein
VLQHFMVAIVHIYCWLLHLWCEFDSSIESHFAGRFWQCSETNPAQLGSRPPLLVRCWGSSIVSDVFT